MEIIKEHSRTVFGTPWGFTKYTVTDDNIGITMGIFGQDTVDCPMHKVQDVVVSRTLFNMIFHTGQVTCYTTDAYAPMIHFINAKNPIQLKNHILKKAEEAKLKRRMILSGQYPTPELLNP